MTLMTAPIAKVLSAVLAGLLVLGACDAAFARHKKKPRAQRRETVQAAPVSHAPVDKDGTPIIMNDYPAPRASKLKGEPEQRADHPIKIPRGSSTYIPPTPSSSGGPPPASMLQTVPLPPPASFGDKAANCLQSFPLNKGVGNNSSDMQTYVRQCAN